MIRGLSVIETGAPLVCGRRFLLLLLWPPLSLSGNQNAKSSGRLSSLIATLVNPSHFSSESADATDDLSAEKVSVSDSAVGSALGRFWRTGTLPALEWLLSLTPAGWISGRKVPS